MSESEAARAIAYIDGFNLYFGMKSAGLRHYYWLDLHKLADHVARDFGLNLVATKYFTARLRPPSDQAKMLRQTTYLDALMCSKSIEIVYGSYRSDIRRCRQCSAEHMQHQEKKTDVNIAIHLLEDAIADRFDTAFLFSADSDLSPALEGLRRVASSKRVITVFPPRRGSEELRKLARDIRRLRKRDFERCQLPTRIETPDGFVLERPSRWAAEP